MPVGFETAITDAKTLKIAQPNSEHGAYTDYNFSVAATNTNSDDIAGLQSEAGSLFIPFNHLFGNINKVAAVTAHFSNWPASKPIVTDASTTDLASILLLASLHDRKVHVLNVTSKDDIKLIALSKEKGLKMTCDVPVYSLFLSQKDFPDCRKLPTLTDQEALWKHLETIDVFSIGSLPYQISDKQAVPTAGIADAVPLLLTAVSEGRMTLDDVIKRLHSNPVTIFELNEQSSTSVEVDIDRPYVLQAGQVWSPFVGRVMRGAVTRVTFHGKTACLDGEVSVNLVRGTDMSTLVMPMSPEVKAVLSPVIRAQTASPFDRKPSILEGSIARRLSISQRPRPSTRARIAEEHLEPSAGPPSILIPQPIPHSMISPSLQSLLSSSPIRNRHILSVNQFSRSDLHLLFTVSQEMRVAVQRQGVLPILQSWVLCTMVFEPSTRTSASFDAAMQRLGGRTVVINTDHYSTKKGDSLQDTLRTLGCYGDAIVLRHPDGNSASIAGQFSPVPVINGGNCSVEYPIQAFLDLFTIREEFGIVKQALWPTLAVAAGM